jgi:hypothetical protein
MLGEGKAAPEETFQMMHWLSTEPDIKDALSGDQAKSNTSLWCILQMEKHKWGLPVLLPYAISLHQLSQDSYET